MKLLIGDNFFINNTQMTVRDISSTYITLKFKKPLEDIIGYANALQYNNFYVDNYNCITIELSEFKEGTLFEYKIYKEEVLSY